MYENERAIANKVHNRISYIVRDLIDEENAHLERDLWPMVLSGIPKDRITIMREAGTCRYIGIMLDGEPVCDGRNEWIKR